MTVDSLEKVIFGADGLRIFGPKVDGTWSVTFTTGEYEKDKVAALFSLIGKVLKVTVEESKDISPLSIP